MNYNELSCPVCGRKFEENDDVVVCPECGTPHHRECYEAEGHCANEARHGEGFTFEKPAPTENEPHPEQRPGRGGEKAVCPVCRHENPPGSEFCEYCGQKLTILGYDLTALSAPAEDGGDENRKSNSFDQRFYGQQTSPSGKVIDGMSADDISEYVRNNYNKYLHKFEKLSEKKLSWNWAAFFFTPYWFFYRKLIKPGIIFLTAMLCVTVIFTNPMNKIAQGYFEMGEVFESETVTEEDAKQVLQDLQKLTMEMLPYVAAFIGLNLLIRVLAALFADKIYKKRVYENIQKIREAAPDQEGFHLLMFKVGGTAPLLVLASYLIEYALSMLAGYVISL